MSEWNSLGEKLLNLAVLTDTQKPTRTSHPSICRHYVHLSLTWRRLHTYMPRFIRA